MLIVSLIILIFVITGLIFTKNYKREEIETLNKKQNPFVLVYSLSFKILDKFIIMDKLKSTDKFKSTEKLKSTNNKKSDEYLNNAKKISIVIFMLSITSFLCVLLTFADSKGSVINDNAVNRPSNVENSENIDMNVYKVGEEAPYEVQFNVEARQYNAEEIKQNFVLAYEYVLENMLKENESLENVTSDLNLSMVISQYAINVDWYSSDYNIVDYDGTVYNSDFETNNVDCIPIQLTANLSYRDQTCEYPIDIKVFPPYLTEEEHFIRAIKKAIAQASGNSIYEDKINLPTDVNGVQLEYKESNKDDTAGVIVVLGIVMTIVLLVGIEGQNKKEKKNRDMQLKYDYSEVVSKLTLLAGAGMTISRAWEKISLDYKKQRENNACKMHFSYEEMLIAYYQMKSGMAEGKAYAEFGKRCNIKEYLKLGALLQQNLKKGTKGLTQMLENESLEAFEERKNIAKRLGEEAGTKLLAPMAIMLVIVMIIVIVPAMLSFSM